MIITIFTEIMGVVLMIYSFLHKFASGSFVTGDSGECM